MVSSPRCQRKSAIFCRFISTAHIISSWNGYWKRLTSGSSTSISISSSFFFFFFFPFVGGSSSWEEKRNSSYQSLTANLTTAPCTGRILRGYDIITFFFFFFLLKQMVKKKLQRTCERTCTGLAHVLMLYSENHFLHAQLQVTILDKYSRILLFWSHHFTLHCKWISTICVIAPVDLQWINI